MIVESTGAAASVQAPAPHQAWAERMTVRAFMNSFLREYGYAGPGRSSGSGLVVPLSFRLGAIKGRLAYRSVIGQHRYGPDWTLADGFGEERPLGMEELVDLLLEETAAKAGVRNAPERIAAMRSRIMDSRRRMAVYADRFLRRARAEGDELSGYAASEQLLYAGHPFHPFPKSVEGFAEEEAALFSPELKASFRLHYIAIAKGLVREDWLDPAQRDAVLGAARSSAEERLGGAAADYAIVPMHPWQAGCALRQPLLRRLLEERAVVDLGPQGPVVCPTSSVRTAWDPETLVSYKLPLHVRITNLVRDNTAEQCRRTMDAARVISRLQAENRTCGLRVLCETGCSRIDGERLRQAVSLLDPEGAIAHGGGWGPDEVASGLAVLYRPMAVDPDCTYVAASLLEADPGEEEPRLLRLLGRQRGGEGDGDDRKEKFLLRYLQLSMLPLLRLLAAEGISLEAHVQNSLVTIRDGLPTDYYVRDLEGVSIVRERAAEAGWTNDLIRADSPVLYGREEAWRRTKYCYFVNQLGSLIHALAAAGGQGEERYWSIAARLLEEELSVADDRLSPYIEDLLASDALPAKANFTSCLTGKGDTPSYVDIPNPLRRKEVPSCR